MRTAAVLLIACAGIAACKTTGAGTRTGPSADITLEEMHDSGLSFSTAHDVVRQFRPQWLITRGVSIMQPQRGSDATLMDYVAIYVDDTFIGGPDTLYGISALAIRSIEHLGRGRAQRLGSRSHIHGAIVVYTR